MIVKFVRGCEGTCVEIGFRVGFFSSLKDGVSIDSDGGDCQSGETCGGGGAGAWGEDLTRVSITRVEEAICLLRLVAISRSSSFCNDEGSDVFEIRNYGEGLFSRTDTSRGHF